MDENNIEIILWLNGKTKENSFKFNIKDYKNISLRRLKESIEKYIKNNNLEYKILEIFHKSNFQITNIYTTKELELGDYDIPYLNKDEILFFSIDNLFFKISNHYYQYEFIKPIKSGGFGEIFYAKHVISQKEYAIKKIDTSNFSNEEIYNISREYMILKNFHHKNIIKSYNSFNYQNTFYTIMDYAKGGELTNLLNEKKILNEKETKIIFKQIYDAVKYMHSQNIIHRDLKPNNILFLDEEKTQIVIIDFGISGFSNGKFKENIKAGTLLFLPPEIVGHNNYSSDIKLDIWALGIILFRMLQGFYPFESKKEKDIIHKILTMNIKFNNKIKISNLCKELISKMLEKNYLYRIDTDSELFQKWFDQEDNINNLNVNNDNVVVLYSNKKNINDLNVHHVFNKKKNVIYKSIFPHSKILIKKNESMKNYKINKYDNENQLINKFHLKNILFKAKCPIKKTNSFFPKIHPNSNLISINNSTLNDSLDDLSYIKNSKINLYSQEKKKLNKNISFPVLKSNKSNYNKKLYNIKFKK